MSEKIHAAMAAVMRDATAVGKDQRNQQQGFAYRGIDDVYNALHGIMAKHGVYMTPEVLERHREERTNNKGTILAFTVLRMRYTFYADDGSHVSCVVEGEGMDSGDKSSNKAMAVAHKYALLQCFLIPTAEIKDPDAESHEVQSESFEARADRMADKLRDSIIVIRESIAEYMQTGDMASLSPGAEAFAELSDDEKQAIWVAPSKMEKAGFAPIFTTQERDVMKTPEFRKAHFGEAA